MKKVALISIYSEDTKGIPPLGPLYLATALKKNGIDVRIIHKSESHSHEIESEIALYHPDLVGMSVFTGYLNRRYVELSKNLKNQRYLIAWGNAQPSLLPEEVLQTEYVDFSVIGEGEATLVELVKNLGDTQKYSTILGLGFKNQAGEIVINDRRPFINIDDYLIDWSLIDLENYIVPYFSGRYKRTLAVTTSRGCPFNCQFCYNLIFNNRRWRGHAAEKMISNLKPIIEKYKIDAIRFLDDNFFVDKERSFMIARGLGLPYFGDCRVEMVDEEFVKNLKETKCLEIMFGLESGSDRILKEVVQKGTTTKDIIKAVTLLKNTGIMASGSFVLGFPGETKAEYAMTMKFICKLLEINNNLAFTVGWFLPYPGTGLYEKAKELGFSPPERIEDWDIFDRWRNDYRMEWIKWDYRLPVKYSRKLTQLLGMAYKRNIPLAKRIFKFRAEHLFFRLPIDIYIFHKLRGIYMFKGDNNFITRFIKKIIIKMMRVAKK